VKYHSLNSIHDEFQILHISVPEWHFEGVS
jgi:hypothetical protein